MSEVAAKGSSLSKYPYRLTLPDGSDSAVFTKRHSDAVCDCFDRSQMRDFETLGYPLVA